MSHGGLSKRPGVLIPLFLLLFACASQPPLHETPLTIAVWDLDDLTPSSVVRPNLGELLSGQIMEAIKKREGYTVIERERLLLALEELRLGTTPLVDETTRLRLGKIVGARWMIFGGYQIIGGKMRIDLRLVDVETGRIRKAVQNITGASDLQRWMDMAKELATELLSYPLKSARQQEPA